MCWLHDGPDRQRSELIPLRGDPTASIGGSGLPRVWNLLPLMSVLVTQRNHWAVPDRPYVGKGVQCCCFARRICSAVTGAFLLHTLSVFPGGYAKTRPAGRWVTKLLLWVPTVVVELDVVHEGHSHPDVAELRIRGRRGRAAGCWRCLPLRCLTVLLERAVPMPMPTTQHAGEHGHGGHIELKAGREPLPTPLAPLLSMPPAGLRRGRERSPSAPRRRPRRRRDRPLVHTEHGYEAEEGHLASKRERFILRPPAAGQSHPNNSGPGYPVVLQLQAPAAIAGSCPPARRPIPAQVIR